MDARIPVHLIVSSLIRRVQGEGGFATVLSKGERDAGTLIVVLTENGTNSRAYERMPSPEGSRKWTCFKREDAENKAEFSEYLTRRGDQDPDLWVIELDIASGERFIADLPND